MSATLPASPIQGLHAVEITAGREPMLQRFFNDNPAYFLAVTGEPARAQEAQEEIDGLPPAGWHFSKKWLIGYADAQDRLVAIADVVADLLAPGVWHIGLFIVATDRHGSGDAQALYRGLEEWAVAHGARWVRLGVVEGNQRAERFWQARGYVQTRTRAGIIMGPRVNAVRLMVKPLGSETLDHYLTLAPRDRPED